MTCIYLNVYNFLPQFSPQMFDNYLLQVWCMKFSEWVDNGWIKVLSNILLTLFTLFRKIYSEQLTYQSSYFKMRVHAFFFFFITINSPPPQFHCVEERVGWKVLQLEYKFSTFTVTQSNQVLQKIRLHEIRCLAENQTSWMMIMEKLHSILHWHKISLRIWLLLNEGSPHANDHVYLDFIFMILTAPFNERYAKELN